MKKNILSNERFILYDAKCDFCSKTVAYIITQKKKNSTLNAIPVQNKEARSILRNHGITFVDLNTIYFIDNKSVYTKSLAIFKILKYTNFPLSWLSFLSILPNKITDKIYSLIAKNRHRF